MKSIQVISSCFLVASSSRIVWTMARILGGRAKRHNVFQRDSLVLARIPTQNPLSSSTAPTQPYLRQTLFPSSTATTTQAVSPAPINQAGTITLDHDTFPPIDPPENSDLTYFNYDTTFYAEYGPGYPLLLYSNATSSYEEVYQNNEWATREIPYDNYWREFDNATNGGHGPYEGVLASFSPSINRCGNYGYQSPIDLNENSECYEFHEERTIHGSIRINSTKVKKHIESNKLRLIYKRACSDCSELSAQLPKTDFAHQWPVREANVIHVDLKVPSEHTIYGNRYDAEWQVFHLHSGRERTPVLASVISAVDDVYNVRLQEALDAFQHVYNVDRASCARKIRKERKLVTRLHRLLGGKTTSTFHDYETWADYSTELEQPDFARLDDEMERKLSKGWSPLDWSLLPSYYFFGYDGSLTEPPCGEWVSWRIVDTPMKIAKFQLEQMKTLIFTHVGPDCQKTSIHWNQSVARPIQDTAGRPVWRCTPTNFLPDH